MTENTEHPALTALRNIDRAAGMDASDMMSEAHDAIPALEALIAHHDEACAAYSRALDAKTRVEAERDDMIRAIEAALSYVRGNSEMAQNVRGFLKDALRKVVR